ncbi:MAG: hypothetical protein AB7E66_16510 [Parvibaculaceae bacterium]
MPRHLPIWPTFFAAITATLRNWRYAWRISWPWLLIVSAATIGSVLAIVLVLGHSPSDRYTKWGPAIANILNLAAPPDYKISLVQNLLLFLLAMTALSAVAVNWHRFLLAGEEVRGLDVLKLDDTRMRYLARFLVVTLVPAAIVFAAGNLPGLFFLEDEQRAQQANAVGALLLFPLAAALFMRLAVGLPAVAVDRADITLSEAWNVTQGNGGRAVSLLLLYLVTLALGHVISLLIGAGFSALSHGLADWVSFLLKLAVHWFVTILAITLFTAIYGYLIEEQDF